MKPRIIVHNPTNFITKKYRYYNIFFDNLVSNLKDKFNIIENRYFINCHKERYPVKLLYDNDNESINYSTIMLECEMILENYDSKEIKILSVSDYFSDINLGLFNNERAKPFINKVLISQFNRKDILHHCYDKNIDNIYSPWIYFPSNLYDLNSLYNQRKKISSFIDKFYFRGTGLEHRPMIRFFNTDLFYGGNSIGNFDNYANELINYKIGFSCAGSAQICYRDIEYMAMGIPMLRFEYTNEMSPNLIPNFHYISAGPPIENRDEHIATQEHAKLIEEKFLQIKDDKNFLDFISNNAREYYLNFIHDQNGIDHTINLLGLVDWA
jgi:hypothetical protein